MCITTSFFVKLNFIIVIFLQVRNLIINGLFSISNCEFVVNYNVTSHRATFSAIHILGDGHKNELYAFRR